MNAGAGRAGAFLLDCAPIYLLEIRASLPVSSRVSWAKSFRGPIRIHPLLSSEEFEVFYVNRSGGRASGRELSISLTFGKAVKNFLPPRLASEPCVSSSVGAIHLEPICAILTIPVPRDSRIWNCLLSG